MLKGLPLAYDRDMQEDDKEPAFDAVDTLELVLPALAGLVETMTVHAEPHRRRGADGLHAGHRGRRLPGAAGRPVAREAHEVTGRLVAWCAARGLALDEPSDDDLTSISPQLTPDVRAVLTVPGALAAVAARVDQSGPVAAQLADAGEMLRSWRRWADETVVPR